MFPVKLLTRSAYEKAAKELEVDVAVIMAVASVESRGDGFIKGTDLPKILFEGHWFHKFTDGRFSREFPTLSHPKWTKANYKGGRGEYDRLVKAIAINAGIPDPALLSTSWGRFQVMGFNFDKAGFASVVEFVNAVAVDEAAQLAAFVGFIRSVGLADELRKQDWVSFSRAYNGPGFAENAHHAKMAAEFARRRQQLQEERLSGTFEPERGDAMLIQTALNVLVGPQLAERLTVDGWVGENTRRAIRMFRRSRGLGDSDRIDRELCDALQLDVTTFEPGSE
jgi:hypothetical protein